MNDDLAPPLAIVGVSCLFPRADGYGAYWANIKAGVDAIGPIPSTHWRPEDYQDADPKAPDRVYTARGGFLDPLDFAPGEFGVAPTDLEAIDTSQLLGLVVARQALLDAGYAVGDAPGKPFDRSRVGVILGVTGTLEMVVPLGARLGHPHWRRALRDAGVADEVANDVVERIGQAYVGWQENSFPGLLGNVVAGRIANRLDLGGTNCVVDAACASSLSALHLAAMELQTGRADAMVTGGVDTFNDIFMYMCFSKTPALSPTGDARPFDAAGDGTILGEGLGMIVLKRLADAERDGDRIYALLRGIGTSSDGKGNAVYAPKKEGQVAALRSAYASAGVDPATVELVEAHGTGTRVGDAVEVSALIEVFGSAAARRQSPWCALGSVKSQIGHTKAAAGAAGLIKAIAALQHKVLPPTIKVREPQAAVREPASPFYLNTERRPWLPSTRHPRRAAVSAFGFGGSNFHCVLEEARPEKTSIDWDGTVQLVALAGTSAADIASQLTTWPTDLPWSELRTRAAASRQAFSPRQRERLVLVIERGVSDLARVLNDARSALAGEQRQYQGVYRGEGAVPGRLACLFPGQGAQYTGMLRDIVCQFPQAFNVLARAETEFAVRRSGQRLSDLLYPLFAFTPEERERNGLELQATDIAQPALGAVEFGAWQVLRYFGVNADACAGHSYGELVALAAAGVISEADLHRLSIVRGELLANAEPGAMLAVQSSAQAISAILAAERLNVTIANKNAPTQTVLSGSSDAIEQTATVLAERKIVCRRLQVGGAFHSPLVAAAVGPLLESLNQATWTTESFPVFANTTGAAYPKELTAARRLFAEQLARPVEFVAEIEALHASGVRTFLEVGPGARLSGLVGSILQGKPHAALAVDASSGKRSGIYDLGCALAHLAARGHAVDLALWDGDFRAPSGKRPAFTVPLCGANYIKPRTPRPPRTAPATTPSTMSRSTSAAPPVPAVASETRIVSNRSTPTADNSALAQALQMTRESLAAVQKMQEQAANLHRQFLDGQDAAQRTLQALVEQQQRLLAGTLGLPVTPTPQPAPVLAPAPAQVPPVAVLPRIVAAPPPLLPAPPPPVPAAPLPPVPMPLPTVVVPSQRIERILLEIVAEKTGYPTDMLELDMALDSDLGIDSIKRVEILSALQDRLPEAPAVKPEHLGTLHSLRDIAAFLASDNVVAPVSTATTVALSSPPSVAAPPLDRVTQVLLEIVAEKTGYPSEMLELDMALDSDLGIDSIKRVEILSALQDRLPEAPAVKPDHLGTLHSLRHIAAFLADTPTTPAAPPPMVAVPTVVVPTVAASTKLERSVVRAVPLDTAAHRKAITLPAGSEIWIAPDDDELAGCLEQQLRRLGQNPRLMSPVGIREEEAPASLAGLILIAPVDPPSDNLLKDALRAAQHVGSALRQSGREGGALFATVARLDGAFGLQEIDPNREPIDGGLAGLTKTLGHEWPEVHAKAFDVAANVDSAAAATQLIEEIFLVGPAEVGISASGRQTLATVVEPAVPSASLPFAAGDVIVVSGGGRGVTADIAIALAKAFRPTLVLLGRNPAPRPEPAGLAHLLTEAELKRELAGRVHGATPKQIGDQVAKLLAARAIRDTLRDIEAAGAKAVYLTADIRQSRALAGLLDVVRREYGPVRGIVHGAGVLADARIEDKTLEQFERVYSTKVDGLRALLTAVNPADLRALLLFSSTTARLGRVAQADYAMANEVLNKIAQQQARRLPQCRVVSLNWGPWDGGMVTPALKKLFAEEGVPLIAPAEGAECVVRELSGSRPSPVEIVVLGGPLGKSPEKLVQKTPNAAPAAAALPLAFERTLDLAEHPVLEAHVFDGRPVLPVALMLEWLAHGALHQNPGLVFHGCNELRVLHGVVLAEGAAPQVRVAAGKAVRTEGMFVVPVEMRGRKADGRDVLHARAEIVLTNELPAVPTDSIANDDGMPLPEYGRSIEECYRTLLFHGRELQGIERIEGCGSDGIAILARNSPLPSTWLHLPLRQRWLTDPLVLDASFQALILWSFQRYAVGSLPCLLGRYRQYRRTFPTGGVRVVARITQSTNLHAIANMDYLDADDRLIARLEGYECVLDPGLQRAFRRNRLAPAGVS